MSPKGTIVPINWIDTDESYAVLRRAGTRKRRPQLREYCLAKGNCHYTRTVPRGIIDLSYRAVVKLGLRGTRFFFSRGSVKKNGVQLVNTVSLQRLAWDAGVSVIIPRRLKHTARVGLLIDDVAHELRVMELAVLMALLSLKSSRHSRRWYADMAASILARGWRSLDAGRPPDVRLAPVHTGSRGATKNISARPARRPARKPIPCAR